MTHPDLDTEPSNCPFDRYPVVAWRVEQGEHSVERFLVLEIDLPNDNLGPMKAPAPVSEVQARARLGALGLSAAEIEARLVWARRWMATRVLKPGAEPVMWLPPL
jgi:hypothetical protein